MPTELDNIIRGIIQDNGPMSVATYWNLCLAHPQYGYYITRDPLGAAGDFTTAPEISQMFGEMVAVWLGERFHHMGAPSKIYVVECGPGRGTLMADIVRIGRVIPNFMDAVSIHLIETSPALRAKQRTALADCQVTWHDTMDTVPNDAPIMIIGNEFLDALPIHQYVFQDGQWFERVIGVGGDGTLQFGLNPSPFVPVIQEQVSGDIFEYSPPREHFISDISARIASQGGAGLMIDYGHDVSACGDTFQAVKNHAYVDALSHCGDADLTSHVDFGRLKDISVAAGLQVTVQSQGDFLKHMGIEHRAAQLAQKSDGVQADLHRLISDDGMGVLFRVMEILK